MRIHRRDLKRDARTSKYMLVSISNFTTFPSTYP